MGDTHPALTGNLQVPRTTKGEPRLGVLSLSQKCCQHTLGPFRPQPCH